MKKSFLFTLVCLSLVFSSCDPNAPQQKVPYVYYGWDYFPTQRIREYFPASETELIYVSDKNDTIKVTSDILYTAYQPRLSGVVGWTTNFEMYTNKLMFHNQYPDSVYPYVIQEMIIGVTAREEMDISILSLQYYFLPRFIGYGVRFENKTPRPDAIFQFLTDTIWLSSTAELADGSHQRIPNTAMVVKGKGFAMYKTPKFDEHTGKYVGFDETWTLINY